MQGPDAVFDGTLRGAARLWRETGRAMRRVEEWEGSAIYGKVVGRDADIRAAEEQLWAFAASSGLHVSIGWPSMPNAVAEISHGERLVLLSPDLSPSHRMAALAHEMGHWMDPWLRDNWEWYDNRHEGDIEIVAQMAAAIFADWYQVDLTAQTDGYLSYWARVSKARREKTVGELLERASISGLSPLPQTDEVRHHLALAKERLRYRRAVHGWLGRLFRNPKRERALGLVDCSDW